MSTSIDILHRIVNVDDNSLDWLLMKSRSHANFKLSASMRNFPWSTSFTTGFVAHASEIKQRRVRTCHSWIVLLSVFLCGQYETCSELRSRHLYIWTSHSSRASRQIFVELLSDMSIRHLSVLICYAFFQSELTFFFFFPLFFLSPSWVSSSLQRLNSNQR